MFSPLFGDLAPDDAEWGDTLFEALVAAQGFGQTEESVAAAAVESSQQGRRGLIPCSLG